MTTVPYNDLERDKEILNWYCINKISWHTLKCSVDEQIHSQYALPYGIISPGIAIRSVRCVIVASGYYRCTIVYFINMEKKLRP